MHFGLGNAKGMGRGCYSGLRYKSPWHAVAVRLEIELEAQESQQLEDPVATPF